MKKLMMLVVAGLLCLWAQCEPPLAYEPLRDSLLELGKPLDSHYCRLLTKQARALSKGRPSDALDCVDEAIRVAQALKDPAVLGFCYLSRYQLIKNQDPTESARLLSILGTLAARQGDQRLKAEVLVQRGYQAYRTAQRDSALHYLKQGEQLAQAQGYQTLLAGAYLYQGWVYGYFDEFEAALAYQSKGIALASAQGDSSRAMRMMIDQAYMYTILGRYPEADSLLSYCVAHIGAIENEKTRIRLYMNLGVNELQQGHYAAALKANHRALDMATAQADSNNMAGCLIDLGRCYGALHEYHKSIRYYSRSLQATPRRLAASENAPALSNIGLNYLHLGQYDSACIYGHRALALQREHGLPHTMAMTCLLLGDAQLALGRLDSSRYYLSRSAGILAQYRDPTAYTQLSLSQGKLAQAEGRPTEALQKGQQALAYADSAGYRSQDTDIYTLLYQAAKELKQDKAALAYHERLLAAKDSLSGRELTRKATQLELEYEFERKALLDSLRFKQREAEAGQLLAEEAAKLERQRRVSYLGLGGALALLALALVLYLAWKRAQTLNNLLKKRTEQVEWLLKEVHHRVKNNLQIISSLMGIQARSLADEGSKAIIRESQSRIKSISLVHESLYSDNHPAEISARPFLTQILDHTVSVAAASSPSYKLEVEDIALSSDQATSLGIIVNELATNSCKHSRPEMGAIEIRLSLSTQSGQALLSLSDNGKAKEEPDPKESRKPLGLLLVEALVKEQLQGTLTSPKSQPYHYNIKFPLA